MTPDRRWQVGPEIVVRLAYELYDAEGELVEESAGHGFLEFLFNSGELPQALEGPLEGLVPGERRRVRLQPQDAFGPRDENALLHVERGELPAGADLGDSFEAESESGAVVFLRVVEADAEGFVLDANHPLAGQSVEFELEVLDTRPATSQELREADARLDGDPAGNRNWVAAASLVRRRGSDGSDGCA